MTGRQAVLHSVALLVVSLAPVAAGLGGAMYLAGAIILGIALALFGVAARDHPQPRGRRGRCFSPRCCTCRRWTSLLLAKL